MASCPCLHPTTALQAGRFPLRQRRLESDAEGCCCATVAAGQVPRLRCRRAVFYRHYDYAAAIRKSGPEIKNRCTKEGVNRQNHALIPKSGPEIKNRCTQKVVFGEILASIPKFGLEIKNRCTQESVNRQKLASIPKSGLEIKNRRTQKDVSGEKPASILKSRPEINNRCSQEVLNEEKLASILKFGPEIKNQCIAGGCSAGGPSPLRQRRLESDAEDRCRDGRCRRNHSPLRQRRIESDAKDRSRYGRSRRAIPILCEVRLSKAMPQLFKGGDWGGGEPY